MKKLVAVLLTATLTFSLAYGAFYTNSLAAIAEETVVAVESVGESTLPVEAAVPQVDPGSSSEANAEPSIEPSIEPEVAAEPSTAQATAGVEEPPLVENVSEEPYWVSDYNYSQLLSEYDALAVSADGTSIILDATLTITSAGDGLQSIINVGAAKVVSSGTNVPDYNNGSAINLTEKEGHPQAGTTSTKSLLKLVETLEGKDVYEATFYFGSDRYPEAPFAAFRTFIALEAKEQPPAPVEAVEEEKVETTKAEVKESYSYYVSTFWSAYHSKDFDTYVTAANFTVSEVGDDGTIKGSVGSQSLTILGTTGEAKALTEALPAAGQTSAAALLTFNGTSYDALFLFGDVSEGSEQGSAVGGVQVSLDPGASMNVESAEPASALQKTPLMRALSAEMGTMSLNPSSFYVGMPFTAYFTGNSWYWNGQYFGAVFGMSLYWDNVYIDLYMHCTEPMVYGPESVSYAGSPVYGSISGIDKTAGYVYIDLWTTGPGGGYQDLSAAGIPVAFTFTGDIALTKSSANPSITNGNSCYDLAGAQYGLYSSWSNANSDVGRIHTFTSNSSGQTNIAYGLNNGSYYVKELVAPKGYRLDATIYTVNHNSALTTFQAKDEPLNDPALLAVQKLDSETGEAYGKDDPNGLLLADGEFTVRYWDAYYDTIDEAEAVGSPTKTWVFKTGANGRVLFVDTMLVAGSDSLFKDQLGNVTLPLGTVAIQETTPPPGYLLPDPNPISLQKIEPTGDLLAPVTRLNTVTVLEEPHEVVVEKYDSDSTAPVADTEFTLYKESTLGAGDWTEVSKHTTNEHGKCVFSPVAVGSYKLDETRANPLYAELEESGDGAHYFEITETSTEEVQVFKNDLIQVSIEVYKNTIPLTNTGLDGTPDRYNNIVGTEQYIYNFGAKSNSNVRVDEFVVTDSLEFVTSKGYRMTTLWTGTSPAGMDYDGLMTVLYRTNMTGFAETPSYSYDLMAANPPNANNPGNNMYVSVEPGWRIWQERISTTSAVRLDVSALGLAPGEYITGVRAVYGGVQKGFYTGFGYGGVRDWSYAVVATGALLPIDEMGNETVMRGSIQADLFRNWGDTTPVLTDIDQDKVETRVIKTFSYDKKYLGITPNGYQGGRLFAGLPITGDSLWIIGIGLVIVAGAGTALIVAAVRKRKKSIKESGHDGN